MNKEKICFSVFCAVLLSLVTVFPAAAQSNEVIDTVIQDPVLLYKNGAYLVMTASGIVPDSVSPEEAFEALLDKSDDWKLKNISAGDTMTLGQYSYLLMRAFSIRGGVFYSIFPGGRYAARELKFRQLIEGPASPYRTLSGEEALTILGRTLDWTGDES